MVFLSLLQSEVLSKCGPFQRAGGRRCSMLSWSEVDVSFYMTVLGRVLATVRRLSVLTG